MSEAAVAQGRPISQSTLDKIRGVAASTDNIGNFFWSKFVPCSGWSFID